jgi:hypothetical protein
MQRPLWTAGVTPIAIWTPLAWIRAAAIWTKEKMRKARWAGSNRFGTSGRKISVELVWQNCSLNPSVRILEGANKKLPRLQRCSNPAPSSRQRSWESLAHGERWPRRERSQGPRWLPGALRGVRKCACACAGVGGCAGALIDSLPGNPESPRPVRLLRAGSAQAGRCPRGTRARRRSRVQRRPRAWCPTYRWRLSLGNRGSAPTCDLGEVRGGTRTRKVHAPEKKERYLTAVVWTKLLGVIYETWF